MDAFHRVHAEWLTAMERASAGPGLGHLMSGRISLAHYQAILRQLFHQVREHPQLMGIVAARLRGRGRDLVKKLLAHAVSETGHDLLALEDLQSLGADVADIRRERPLPATSAILGFAFRMVEHDDPLGFFGYLFHLEFLPTAAGDRVMAALRNAGVPDRAMRFIADHAHIDHAHNRLMATYLGELVQDERDLGAVLHGMHATIRLYGAMLAEAMESVDEPGAITLLTSELGRRAFAEERRGG